MHAYTATLAYAMYDLKNVPVLEVGRQHLSLARSLACKYRLTLLDGTACGDASIVRPFALGTLIKVVFRHRQLHQRLHYT